MPPKRSPAAPQIVSSYDTKTKTSTPGPDAILDGKVPHDELGQPPKKVVQIRRRSSEDWMSFLKRSAEDHWRILRITIQFREKLHAGKPAQLDAAEAMLKARGLEAAIEAVNIDDPNELAEAAAETVNEGLCEFHRREGKPGIWMPSNHVKAMLKENWSVLGYRQSQRGSRGALAEGVFVFSTDPTDPDWLYIGEKPDGVDTNVSHTTGPKGPQSSIKRNEFVWQKRLTFDVKIAKAIANKLDDELFADMLHHASEHGLGANRSQGQGRFSIVNIEEQ